MTQMEQATINELTINGKAYVEKETVKSIAGQIDKLALFIMNNVPGEPSQSESAVDCAIRIMQTQKKKLDWIHVNDKLPEPGQRVIIEGGIGFQRSESWVLS